MITSTGQIRILNDEAPKTFTEFLEDMHFKGYNGHKDNVEVAYDRWLSGLDTQEVIDYAEEYVNLLKS